MAGSEFIVVKNEKEARELAAARAEGLERNIMAQAKLGSMEKMLAIHEARHAQMLANVHLHLEAVKAFYPQLSESQQSVFDKLNWHPRGKRASWQHP